MPDAYERAIVLYSTPNGEQRAAHFTAEQDGDNPLTDSWVIDEYLKPALDELNYHAPIFVIELFGDERPTVVDAAGDEVAMTFHTIDC